MTEFLGRFHPVLVHLPIGMLLIAVVFIWLKESEGAIKISLALGALAAIASMITGLLLSQSGDYDPDAVWWHQWMGIVTAIASIGLWFIKDKKWPSVVLTALILITGHLGGSLTHGSGYLTASLNDNDEEDSPDISKLDMKNAAFYNDAIRPMFEARCYSCHGENKQKGGLRLDNPDLIMKGGKNGKVIEPGNPEESDLIKRILLPSEDEDHMPPKEKKQLTEQERKLISLWIESGSDFTKKISESLNDKQISAFSSEEKDNSIQLPDVSVPAPDEDLMSKLTEQEVAISPVAKGSNFLQVNFISVPNDAQRLLETLKPIARNIVLLKLNGTNVDDQSIAGFENLTSLSLSDTKVTNAVIDQLVKLKYLVSLNLSGTKVTSVAKLKDLKSLKYLNIYNTAIEDADLPNVKIEKGNYDVPTLEGDTTVLKSH